MTPFAERYEFVLHWLQRRRAHVAAAVMRLGRVRMTEAVATAAIVVRDRELTLYFNPGFVDRISIAELAGVLTHEALHFFLRHPKRAAAMTTRQDQHLFKLACEAVVNDLILNSLEEARLPEDPVTGMGLLGRDTSSLSAEEVRRLLLQNLQSNDGDLQHRVVSLGTVDDHDAWEWPPEAGGEDLSPASPEGTLAPLWTEQTSQLVDELLRDLPRNTIGWGALAAAVTRPVKPARGCRRSLARYLDLRVAQLAQCEALWTIPNRKLLGLYPQVILPVYEDRPAHRILIAIDTSGSVPDNFIAVARAFAAQRASHVRITLVSFDVQCYECVDPAADLRGGGGTRAQAVEEFIKQRPDPYPDLVFLLTDGFTPPPMPRHPDRWIWLLMPGGSKHAVPSGSVAERFGRDEV